MKEVPPIDDDFDPAFVVKCDGNGGGSSEPLSQRGRMSAVSAFEGIFTSTVADVF
jgi:hypothetical protein